MPALAHDVVSFVLTELSSRLEAAPADSRIAYIAKKLEGPATRFTASKLGQTTLNTADRLLTVADGAFDYAMNTKTYSYVSNIVVESVIPAANSTAERASATACYAVSTASDAKAKVVTNCMVVRDGTLRHYTRGRSGISRAGTSARNTLAKGVHSARVSTSNAISTVRATPGRVSETIYHAVIATRASINSNLARAVANAHSARDYAVTTMTNAHAFASAKYSAARATAILGYSQAEERVVGFLSSVFARLSTMYSSASATLSKGRQDSKALVLRKASQLKTLATPLADFFRSRFAFTPGFYIAGASSPTVAFNPVASVASSPVSDVSDTESFYEVSENPAEAVHFDAPVQEASQPKASSDKKKKSKKTKVPKQAPGMSASPAREVLGVRNVITEARDIFNV